ncbi:hypothetical protein J2753_001110 [Halolamina salifodinae]|uniref:Uncharacterized protein n=1 Tax=Halolamina salifodinae TaxID=1202767 RepID=A0A8T4GUQ1_9EURY|nr:hypothetical protein [Halolamina salifodinae]
MRGVGVVRPITHFDERLHIDETQLLADSLRLTMGPIRLGDDSDCHAEFIGDLCQPGEEVIDVTGRFGFELREWFALGLGDVEHRRRLEPDKSLGPLLGRRLVVLTVAVLVVARRVLTLGATLRDDRRPDPDGRFTFLDVAVELFVPRPVAGDLRGLGALALDQECVRDE